MVSLLLLSIYFFVSIFDENQALVSQQTFDALYSIHNSTFGDYWIYPTDANPWIFSDPNTYDPCKNEWSGIVCNMPASKCDDSICFVTEINLQKHNLKGKIPYDLSKLFNLTSISFAENYLSGPVNFGIYSTMEKLKTLLLSENFHTGQLSYMMSSLSTIETLNLRSNRLVGTIPNEIRYLTTLKELLISINFLTSTIPDVFDDLNHLTYLR